MKASNVFLLKKFVIRMAIAAGTCVFGGLLNLAALLANHGFMPVFAPGCPENLILDSRHMCAGSHSRLLPLIDMFYYHGWIYSLGDLFIFVGQVLGLISILLMAVDCIAHYAFGRGPKASHP